jgi:subtilase family serine protease
MNIGNRDSQKSVVKYYLSDNEAFDAEDTFLKQVSLGKLRAGKSTLKTLSYDFPYGVSASGKYIIAVIDFDNKIIEMNENNNIHVYGPIP